MIIDLLHNRIVKETVTEAFEKSVSDSLIPKLSALYGDALEGVQMYEDYLNDNFSKDGYWYYPLTVLISGINTVVWIKWDVSDASSFEGGVPYAYTGEGIDFIVADDTPIAFKNAIEGRANYFEGGYVKTNVITDAPSYTILSGKYSQTFIDEMTRQITRVISKSCGVEGLEESSIEIDIAFAPNTYMEHTSENVTYRRLLISAKGCTARDFWIKWTRLNSSVAFSVNDNVSEGEIVFELGEDVSQKIREKEYRFLVYGNSEKYRVAMGRKNITEWRELIKRAVKRGELRKPMSDLEKGAHISEVSDKLSEILEKCGITIPVGTDTEIKVSADAANEALRLAVVGEELTDEAETAVDMAEDAAASFDAEPEQETAPEKTEEEFVPAGLEITDSEAEDDDDFDFDKEHEQFEISLDGDEPSPLDVLAGFMPEPEQMPEEDEVEDAMEQESEPDYAIDDHTPEILEQTETAEPMSDEDAFIAALVSAGKEDEPETTARVVTVTTPAAEDPRADASEYKVSEEESLECASLKLQIAYAEAKQQNAEDEARRAREDAERVNAQLAELRDTIEDLRAALEAEKQMATELRVELEKQKFATEQIKRLADDAERAKTLAEAEAARLRAEHDELKRENVNLVEVARAAEEACAAAEEKSRICEEKLDEQVELFEKEKIRQKNLFAEAARQAKEELDKSAAEEAEAQADLAAEEARLEAIRAEAERIRREAELEEQKARLEAEALRRMSERTQTPKTIEERALEARLAMEERARRLAEERTAGASAASAPAPVLSNAPVAESTYAEPQAVQTSDEQTVAEPVSVQTEPEVAEPVEEPIGPDAKYTYTAKLVRILFKNTVDRDNITSILRDLINEALKTYGYERLYMEVKAGVTDGNTVVLNFVRYPEEEYDLLVNIIKYIGNAGLGIYKIILE